MTAVGRRALAVLRGSFTEGQLLPDLREWPWRALLAACLCPAGRDHLRHRYRAWTALPGECWRDPRRMVEGVIVDVPTPGTATLRCATAEILYCWPGALDHPTALEHLETVDLREWSR